MSAATVTVSTPVLAYSPHPNDEGRAIAEYVPLDTLLRESDVVSLHCNLTAENTGLICKETIEKMKDGAMLLNTARGQLLCEQDVADALNSGKLGGAAMDVVCTEPLACRQRIMDTTVQNVRAFLAGTPQNIVNM